MPITVNTTTNVVTVTQNPTSQVTILARGPKGDQGDPGLAGAGYTHTQGSAATTWTIAHNLGLKPSATAYTVGGVEMEGTVTHVSTSVLTIEFNTAVAGYARLV